MNQPHGRLQMTNTCPQNLNGSLRLKNGNHPKRTDQWES
jgi:hypothetical protein